MYFAFETGHFRSCLCSKSVDADGDPLPWYTYPAIEFLSAKNFAGKRILEFGAGQSTLWWAQRSESVVALENNRGWYDFLRARTLSNVSLFLVDQDLTQFEELPISDSRFDVIVIDGMDRSVAACKSLNLLRPGGVFIFDNSDDHDKLTHDTFRKASYRRVDFYGFSPANTRQHCTSIFFKNDSFLFDGQDDPRPGI